MRRRHDDIVWVNRADNDVQIWEMNNAGNVAIISFRAGTYRGNVSR